MTMTMMKPATDTTAMSNAERQAKWRAKRNALAAAAARAVATGTIRLTPTLRNATGLTGPAKSLRNVKDDPKVEALYTRDEQLTKLRQQGEALAAAYLALKLTATERANIDAHFTRWRSMVTKKGHR